MRAAAPLKFHTTWGIALILVELPKSDRGFPKSKPGALRGSSRERRFIIVGVINDN